MILREGQKGAQQKWLARMPKAFTGQTTDNDSLFSREVAVGEGVQDVGTEREHVVSHGCVLVVIGQRFWVGEVDGPLQTGLKIRLC